MVLLVVVVGVGWVVVGVVMGFYFGLGLVVVV